VCVEHRLAALDPGRERTSSVAQTGDFTCLGDLTHQGSRRGMVVDSGRLLIAINVVVPCSWHGASVKTLCEHGLMNNGCAVTTLFMIYGLIDAGQHQVNDVCNEGGRESCRAECTHACGIQMPWTAANDDHWIKECTSVIKAPPINRGNSIAVTASSHS
jgi:hypothetical protein